ncbi:MAG: hypothetical protein M3P50_06700 [Actinomycetota bacterium]|nr:hypothetical protein [Actinomycetota bacterium]
MGDLKQIGQVVEPFTARLERHVAELHELGLMIPDEEPKCALCRDDERHMKPRGGFHPETGRPIGGMEPCPCGAAKRVRAEIKAIAKGIPRGLRNWNLDRLSADIPREVKTQLREFVEVQRIFALGTDEEKLELEEAEILPSDGLWLHGVSGSAKTLAAVAVAQEISAIIRKQDPTRHRHGWELAYWRFERLLARLRETFDADREHSYTALRDALQNVDLLVLDDLMADHLKDWGIQQIYAILDDRIENARPTIVVTDFTPDRLREALSANGQPERGERIIRRLEDFAAELPFEARIHTRPRRRTFLREGQPDQRIKLEQPYGEMPAPQPPPPDAGPPPGPVGLVYEPDPSDTEHSGWGL